MGTRVGSWRASSPIMPIVINGVKATSAPMREASMRFSDSAKLM